jgi:hypothetical protein
MKTSNINNIKGLVKVKDCSWSWEMFGYFKEKLVTWAHFWAQFPQLGKDQA